MNHPAIQKRLPGFLRRRVLDFETRIDSAVAALAGELAPDALVLDAGAGEARHAPFFGRQRYLAVDLAVGDGLWDYGKLHAIADLAALPVRTGSIDACLNIVTLEHVPEPAAVVNELARVLKPGGRLLLAAPLDWEVHQAPHDYYRYTRHGLRYLLERAGFVQISIRPAGGMFTLLSRRLLNSLRYFRGVWFLPAAVLLAPPALLLPVFDRLDRDRDFTLGYICTARRRS